MDPPDGLAVLNIRNEIHPYRCRRKLSKTKTKGAERLIEKLRPFSLSYFCRVFEKRIV